MHFDGRIVAGDDAAVVLKRTRQCVNLGDLFAPPQNIFAMDLRSANKALEKPPPRLRLSLTRSMSTDVDAGERGSLYRRLARRKIKHRASKRGLEGPSNKTMVPLRKTEEPMEEDWCGTSEEEKQESEGTAEETHKDSLYGWFVQLVVQKVNRSDVDLSP